jgi:co-chaperonin GroES (HSP10)
MKFRPLHDRVIIRRAEGDAKSRAATTIPAMSRKSRRRVR